MGGAAFAGSLAYLVYFYAVTLAATTGDPSRIPQHVAWNVALFAVFAAHHSLLARSWAKRRVAATIPPRLERSSYVWVASGLLVLVCWLWAGVPGLVYEADGWWRLPFWTAQGFGILLTVLAARVIDPLDLAGVRQTQERGAPAIAPADTIRMVGPFRVVRHPIYLGWMLIVFGTPVMTANRLLFAVLTSAYLLLAIPWEERSMVDTYGDTYRRYQDRVRWRIVPGLW